MPVAHSAGLGRGTRVHSTSHGPILFFLTNALPQIFQTPKYLGSCIWPLFLPSTSGTHSATGGCPHWQVSFYGEIAAPFPLSCIRLCSYSQPSPARHSSHWCILLSLLFSSKYIRNSDVFRYLSGHLPTNLQCRGISLVPPASPS